MESIFVQLIANSICAKGLTIIQPADGVDKVGPIIMRFIHEWIPDKSKEDEMRLKYDVTISTVIKAHLINELVLLIVGYCPITEQDFVHLIQADTDMMHVINTRLIKGPISKSIPGNKRVLVVTGSVEKFINDMIYKHVYASSNDCYMDMGTFHDALVADRALAESTTGVDPGIWDSNIFRGEDSTGFILHVKRKTVVNERKTVSNDIYYEQLMSCHWDVIFVHNDGYYDDSAGDKKSEAIAKRLTDIPATIRYYLRRRPVQPASGTDTSQHTHTGSTTTTAIQASGDHNCE